MEKLILSEKLDPDFKFELSSRPGGENLKKCFACGTCTAGCPVFHVEREYNPRRIIRLILLGLRERVLSSRTIWLCSQCYTCTANCPQEVDFSQIMFTLRDLAVKEGYAPASLREKIDQVTTAANEFRRDCIHLLLGEGQASIESVKANVEKALAAVKG